MKVSTWGMMSPEILIARSCRWGVGSWTMAVLSLKQVAGEVMKSMTETMLPLRMSWWLKIPVNR